jgi:chorismate mutase
MGCQTSKPHAASGGGNHAIDSTVSGSNAEQPAAEVEDSHQETRILASTKAQAAKPNEEVYKTSLIITQIRNCTEVSSAFVGRQVD